MSFSPVPRSIACIGLGSCCNHISPHLRSTTRLPLALVKTLVPLLRATMIVPSPFLFGSRPRHINIHGADYRARHTGLCGSFRTFPRLRWPRSPHESYSFLEVANSAEHWLRFTSEIYGVCREPCLNHRRLRGEEDTINS